MLQMHYFAGSRPWSFNELTALKEKYREVFGERPGLRASNTCFAASPGNCRVTAC